MKKICSLFCIVFLFLSMIPFPVFALDAGNSNGLILDSHQESGKY
ncbi:MAG: hypothetical protein PUK63_00520 [Clostridiales bacterium]|nr:hypothetical protein [Clostridiales bacterium]MDY3062066.1 hypothetical protein [Eubacteriales bacterium]